MTGAAQGLGRVIAKRLAEEGAKLVVCDIQEDRLTREFYLHGQFVDVSMLGSQLDPPQAYQSSKN